MTCVDENGNRLFGDKDHKELGQKAASALDRIFETAQRLNALGNEDVEALVKNYVPGLSDDSPSD